MSESGFSGFHFARLALFAIIANPAKTNTNEILPVEYARRENPDFDEIYATNP